MHAAQLGSIAQGQGCMPHWSSATTTRCRATCSSKSWQGQDGGRCGRVAEARRPRAGTEDIPARPAAAYSLS